MIFKFSLISYLLCATLLSAEDGIFVRAQLQDPAAEWRVAITSHWAQGKHGTIFAGRSTGAKADESQWAGAGERSEWVDLSKFIPSGVASVIFKFETKTKSEGPIKAHIDIAIAADDNAIVRGIVETDTGRVISLRIPAKLRAESERLLTIREDSQRRLNEIKALNLPDGPLPKKIWCMTGFRSNGEFYTDPKIAELDLDIAKILGMNGYWEQNGGQPRHTRALAEARGMNRSTVYWRDVESPPKDKNGRVPADWERLQKYIDDTYARAINGTRKAHPNGLPTVIADLMDEPAGHPFGGEKYQEQFRDFVQRQGFDAKFFGKDDWVQVTPIEFNWRTFFKQRAEMDLKSVEARRLFYWSLKYWNNCTARFYSMATRKVQELCPGTQTRVNPGPPWWYDYGTLPRGIDYFEMGRLRGVTLGFNEDWCGTGSARLPLELNTLLVDWSRAAMRPSEPLLGSYITRDADRNSVKLRTFACLARECKIFDFYYYGPAYTFFDHWSDNKSMVQGVAEVIRDIGQADDILWEAKAPRAEVALLYSHSWPVWKEDDTEQCEQMMVYLALLHAGIPCDIVEDAEILDGRFAARGYKCLYVVNQSVAAATAAEIERWVNSGGTLAAAGWAGMRDEYNTPTNAWNNLLGVKSRSWKVSGKNPDRLGQILEPADHLRPIHQRDVTIEHDPAHRRNAFIYDLEWAGGVHYMNSATELKGTLGKAILFPPPDYNAKPTANWSSQWAQNFSYNVRAYAGVKPIATTSVHQILAWPLWTQTKGVILLANFTGEPAKELTVTFTSPIPIKSIRSIRTGDLTPAIKHPDPTHIELTLPLNDVTDMLIVE